MAHYSPLRYPGGKSSIFGFVSSILGKNDLIGASYAEPYAGGAGLALKLLIDGYVNHIYINDYDTSIYAFWKTLIEEPDKLCTWIEEVELSIELWEYYRSIQKCKESIDVFELAKSTFFLNRTNVSGIIKGGVIGGYTQQGKYKIDARFNRRDLIARVQKIACFKSQIHVSNFEGLKFIKKMDNKNEEIFIYLDPPYYQKGSSLYMNYFNDKDHQNLAAYIYRIKKKWMVSYDNHKFILNLYAEKPRIVYQLAQSASNRVGNEVLIFSDKIEFSNSLNHLKSPGII